LRKLIVFNQVSLDGYFVDANGDMNWAHNQNPDKEWDDFVNQNAQSGGLLIFGRITYDLMASFWPTPFAAQSNPIVAERMNSLQKIVFSTTMQATDWSNTRLVHSELLAEIQKLKNENGLDMVIMGSGSLVTQLAQAGLIDEYQIVVIPIVLSNGRTLFENILAPIDLKLISSRVFANGNVFLCYKLK